MKCCQVGVFASHPSGATITEIYPCHLLVDLLSPPLMNFTWLFTSIPILIP